MFEAVTLIGVIAVIGDEADFSLVLGFGCEGGRILEGL